MTVAAVLPQPVAQEILRRYADVLRVGSLEVNGDIVRWKTDTSNELQLHHFSEALFGKLRRLPELAQASDEVLRQASYWVCKAVSINYALIEVLLLVKRRVGAMCTIETWGDAGGLVSYSIEARPTQVIHVRLSWRGKNNIVYRDPLTAAKRVKGTLSCLETEFSLPPARRFAPCYRLHVKFEKTMAARLVSTVTCGDSRRGCGAFPETILIKDPLRSEFPLETPQACPDSVQRDMGLPLEMPQMSTDSVRSSTFSEEIDVAGMEPLDIDEYCEVLRKSSSLACSPAAASSSPPPSGSDPSAPPLSSPRSAPPEAEPRTSTARSAGPPAPAQRAGPAAAAEPRRVGELRVRVVRAWDLPRRQSLVGGSVGGVAELYCRCSVGGRTEQTRPVPAAASPEWSESWDFPVQDEDLRGEVLVELLEATGSLAGGRRQSPMGRARVPVCAVLGNGGKASAVRALDGAKSGSVELELELLTEGPDPDGDGGLSEDDLEPEESECLIEVGAIPPSVARSQHDWAV